MTFPVRPADLAAMQQALHLARQGGDRDEVPVGAVVITADGAVLGAGHNERIALSDPTAYWRCAVPELRWVPGT